MAKVLFLAALLSLSLHLAWGEVVKVAIQEGSTEAKGAGKRQEKWHKVAGGSAAAAAGEPEGICRNVNCPNSTICREVNPECKVCGYDQRCHSGSVCNHRCEKDDQCGGECSSCEGQRCVSPKKCTSYFCSYDWDCSDYPGDCSQCGMDGVCHTNSGICGVACKTDRDCGGDCQACKFGLCASQNYPQEYPSNNYPREYPSNNYPREYPSNNYPREYPSNNYPREYPSNNYPREYPSNNYPREYPSNNYPREYPSNNYPREYPSNYPQEYPSNNYPREYPSNNYPREYPSNNYPRYPWDATAKAPKISKDTTIAAEGDKGTAGEAKPGKEAAKEAGDGEQK